MKKNKKDSFNEKNKRVFGAELDSVSREAYNLLKTNVAFAFPDNEGGKVIGISSPCPRDGKSTLSINFAFSLADGGNRVLLIDCDMRRPALHFYLNQEMIPGISNMLISKNDDTAIRKGILHENLDLITSGDIPPNPSELVSSEKLGTLINKFKSEYDYVIIDLPPVLPVSDTVAISKKVDGIIIVAKHNSTRRRDVNETIRQLEYAQARVIGFAYNKG